MFLAAEEEDSRCCPFNPPLLFIYEGHWLKAHTAYHINKSNLCHTR